MTLNARQQLTLADLNRGQCGVVTRIAGDNRLKLRLAEMGFVRGAEVEVEQAAPLGNPRIYTIRGYRISLRNEEAAQILVALPEAEAEAGEG